MNQLKLTAINEMDRDTFVRALGGIFEHSPWVAEGCVESRPFASIAALHEAMTEVVRSSPEETVLELLRAHPDLGTRLAVTDYSASEQSGAGLDRLTPEEYERMTALNEQYVEKFGFPFILAVKGKSKDEIVASMEARVLNGARDEREEALAQIGRITRFRLEDLVDEQ
ncbi:2-oxo-4-hydroxy-4-carboxy-5-ureidoimidazoline decarboxylase [Cohnella lubricantis]|uniref:2-oxo-4-hydroxy-4-carboxy-5-ureidoimidazoline decarboxylase n=1 Tax=Cohnella lubricantis TaxID=2163172 RepID=A0A841T6N0_9BACL|nr:2-oxo-4-hydroxy-4-carboxy-5-ureidoimidazoline decarboxylase [Cohnella lubricantis]MBB6676994.1 2-oxo-4-hydroxy-4-carboxy-5-ureidoimidazoline decarboxylase [Cohnella lubricantis]MBP2117052.1 2-oxo-4-hydroxy-4-carboxy-5-ureidoimidazoline decarboxylase [Cohnella lubricantis]